jgi:hypothetical protein
MVLGDFNRPMDWAPDIGHGTIEPFSDVPWLTPVPDSGTVAILGQQVIHVTLGDASLAPGTYHAKLVLITNAPKAQQISIDVTLDVALPAAFGGIRGTVTDAHAGDPLDGASVTLHAEWPAGTPLDVVATAAADGTYSLIGPEGTWPTEVTYDGYVPQARDVSVVRAVATPGVDWALHRSQPHAALGGEPLPTFILLPDDQGNATLTLGNPEGHTDLTFEVLERSRVVPVAGTRPAARPGSAGVLSSKAPAGHTARKVSPAISGQPTLILEDTLPWDSDAIQQVLAANGVAYDVAGSADIPKIDLASYHAIYVGSDQSQAFYDAFFADEARFAAFVSGGGVLWFGAAAFGFENGNLDGAVLPGGLTIHGPTLEDQNAVEAPDHPLMAGMPNPFSGTAASHVTFSDLPGGATLVASGSGGGEPTLVTYDYGAGRIIAVGQTIEFGWAAGQDTGLILENGVPYVEVFQGLSDVPWLSETPVSGTITPDGSMDIGVAVDTSGLAPGLYLASVLIKTNDPDQSFLDIPVTLIVPAYQQGINAGGKDYVTSDGTVYVADRQYENSLDAAARGGHGGHGDVFGWVGRSDTQKTKSAIAGTDEDGLYQDLREGATGYKFTVPEGIYLVELDFAEFKAKKALERVFGVNLEGEEVIASLDVFKQAGGKNTALQRTFVVTVTDGVLDIDFLMPKGHKSIVNGILVTELPPGAPGT